jgi:type IX secretion system PorP/SprF family membrane protein
MSGRTILEKIQKNGGLGISVIRDKAGDLGFGTTNAMITLGSSVALSQNSVLGIGIGTGLLQYSVDFTTANWGNGNTSNETNLISKQSFADLAAGVTWKYGRGESYISANDEFKALIGFSISHLTSPKIQFYNNYVDKLYWKMNFHGTFLISVPNSRINFTPAYLLSKQGPSTEFIFGTHVRYRIKEASRYTGFIKESQAYAGLFYRAGDALITQVGIDLGSVSLCFSYDFNISRLTPATNMLGSLEFGIRFNSPNPFLYQAKSY